MTDHRNNGVIYLQMEGLSELAKRIEKAGRTAARMADSVAATTAAIGRRSYRPVLESTFDHMGDKTYWKGSPFNGGRGSTYDESLGGFRSNTYRTSNGFFRESNFSFETVAAQRSASAFHRSVAKVKLTSQTANLWEHNTKAYTKNSPFWKYKGDRNPSFVSAGNIRTARPFFLGRARPLVISAIAEAIKRTEDKYSKEFEG